MLIRDETIEYIARNIGEEYSGPPLYEKLKMIVPTDGVVIYPNTKWRMVFDTMKYCSQLDDEIKGLKALIRIIELSIHPLNIKNDDSEKTSRKLIEIYNNKLFYDGLEIQKTKQGKDFQLVKIDQRDDFEDKLVFTSSDYIAEAINYFKDEYNKIRIGGLTYEYRLGMNFAMSSYEPNDDEINYAFCRLKAIEQLRKIGFITSCEIENRTENNYGDTYDYAICTIDESRLTQKEEPVATDYGVQSVQKVVHEHVHRFENSAQEKTIEHKHDFEKKPVESFYITKEGDEFKYKGKFLSLTKNTDYYKTFSALFAKLPKGGEITYKEIIKEVKSRIPTLKDKDEEKARKFIQSNLTDRNNGFFRYAEIPATEDNGRPLIEIIRSEGLRFNNKTG